MKKTLTVLLLIGGFDYTKNAQETARSHHGILYLHALPSILWNLWTIFTAIYNQMRGGLVFSKCKWQAKTQNEYENGSQFMRIYAEVTLTEVQQRKTARERMMFHWQGLCECNMCVCVCVQPRACSHSISAPCLIYILVCVRIGGVCCAGWLMQNV